MAAGLFELRKDPITGWWVATVVDRAFHRDRFARAAEPVDDRLFGCANCSTPDGDGVRVRMLKDFAFHVVGTDDDARELDRGLGQVALAQARATGSWRTIVAPPDEHRALHAVGNDMIEALVGAARDALAEARVAGQTDYLQVVQNWGAQAGARTNHLCLDLYDLPQVPHRIAEEMGGAARFVIREGECPFCRLVRDESRRPDRLVWEDNDSVAFAPYASRSPFEVWIVPRRHEADFGRATTPDVARPPRPFARSLPGWPRASMDRRTTSSCTRRRCASRSTRPTTGTGRSTRGCGRSPGWSSAPGCRSTPSRPRTLSKSSWRQRRSAWTARGELVGPARIVRHMGVRSAVFGPTSARRPVTALREPSRSENLWSSIPPSLTFATRSAAPCSGREPAP